MNFIDLLRRFSVAFFLLCTTHQALLAVDFNDSCDEKEVEPSESFTFFTNTNTNVYIPIINTLEDGNRFDDENGNLAELLDQEVYFPSESENAFYCSVDKDHFSSSSEEEDEEDIGQPLYTDAFERNVCFHLCCVTEPAIIDEVSILSLHRCDTKFMETFICNLGDLTYLRAAFHVLRAPFQPNLEVPSSFEGRIKTLAILLDDLYIKTACTDLPLSLDDLLNVTDCLTLQRVQGMQALLCLPVQYFLQEMKWGWNHGNQKYYDYFRGSLKQYIVASEPVVLRLCLYENIFFFEDLNALMPSFTKKKLMEMAWQDRVKEAQPVLEEPEKE